ncbi:hypothetical protein MPSEU_000783300 [Mayamaea pseudoterrestris]|nr:hypothetical protein MPSEU_000783300 [Mayamaea pseudoterrestris]
MTSLMQMQATATGEAQSLHPGEDDQSKEQRETIESKYAANDEDSGEDDDDDDEVIVLNEGGGKLENDSTPRRSSRKRTSTVIHVKGGHAIKKENNYVLKGHSYVFGVRDEEQVAPKQRAPKKARQTNGAAAPAKPKSNHEQRRMQFKEEIKQAIAAKKDLRLAFLKKHLPSFVPFIDPKVAAGIRDTPMPAQAATRELQVLMQPDAIKAELRDYQMEGLQFMARMYACNMGMILGDEMGLGKTIQTISLICYLKEHHGLTGPNLIICPMSVLYSWCSEIKKWSPSLKYLRFHSSSTTDASIHNEDLMKYDMIVTTYEMAKAPKLAHFWQRHTFRLLVLDEGHRIKSTETQTTQAICKIHAENRLILTGTPLSNTLTELYSLLHFLAGDVFTTSEPFDDAFDLTLNKVDDKRLSQAHIMLSTLMLQRRKEKVEKLIPTNLETKVICPLSTIQIWWYKAILLKDIALLSNGGAGKGKLLSNLIMQLRKCCLHPFLFDGAEDIGATTLELLIGASGKLAVLDKLLCSLYRKKHRVCLFSQFTRVLDILEDYCIGRGWKFVRFDGSTARAKRNFVVNSFNAPNSDKFLFLMSTRAGGMGLNLQTADTCILYDSDWNPSADKQAMARVCRIGQTKKVHTYRLVTEGTVEERMIERAEKKLYLDRMVTRDGSELALDDAEGEDVLDEGVLMATLKFGCSAVFGQGSMKGNRLPFDDDIELITDRSRTDDFSQGNLRGGTLATAKDFDATKMFSSTTDFAGIDFAAIRKQYEKQKRPGTINDIGEIWKKKREVKQRIQMVESKGSGYGSAFVPVLKSNDYDLESGEPSVFQNELKGRRELTQQKKKVHIEHQDFCQVCTDGGSLIECPRCPCCVHLECSGVDSAKNFLCCSHHRCEVCEKPAHAAGGFIFPCSACPKAFCEDHLPKEATFLEPCDRMEALDFTIKNGVYIHCSSGCETLAIKEFGFKPAQEKERNPCPEKLDVASHFGGEVDDSLEAPEDLVVHHKRDRKQVRPTTNEGTRAAMSMVTIESPDTSGDSDDDFVMELGHTSPHRGQRQKPNSKWTNAVAVPSASVHVLVDGITAPLPGRAKQPSIRDGNTQSSLLSGEYDVFLPVIDKRFGLRIVEQGQNVVFASYAKTSKGTACFAERSKLIRNSGDVLVKVGDESTEGKSFQEVKQMIATCISANVTPLALRFFDIKTLRYQSQPFRGVVNESLVAGHSIAHKPESKAPANKLPSTSNNPHPLQYTAKIPPVNGKLFIIIVKGSHGGSCFSGYERHSDGSRGFAELHGLIRNVGDRIIAIDGSPMMHMQHKTIACVLQERAKTGRPVTLLLEQTTECQNQSAPYTADSHVSSAVGGLMQSIPSDDNAQLSTKACAVTGTI